MLYLYMKKKGYIRNILISLPKLILVAILGLILSFKLFSPDAIFEIKYRPIEKGELGTAILSIFIRVGFALASKLALKALYGR